MRPAAGGGFVLPLTFGNAAYYWCQNITAAGWCVITSLGADHAVARPARVDRATAGPAFPRHERLAQRLIGISEFVWLTEPPAGSAASAE